MHEDVGASCELGSNGVATAISLGVWPFLLVVQAYFLSFKANKLEADFERSAKNRALEAPVIEVNDENNKEEEDATVDESLEKF
jgi:hypothetical protein